MNRSLRVIQVANQAGPLRLFMLSVCRRMRETGAHVELACMEFGPNYRPLAAEGFPLHGLTPGSWSKPLTWWRAYRELRSLLRQGDYDLMVVHTPVMSWIARYAARDCVSAVVYMAHGLPFAPQQGRLARWALRHIERFIGRRYTDALLVMNRTDAEACEQFPMTRLGGRWFLVPGVGIDLEFWDTPPSQLEQEQLDGELGPMQDRPIVLYLGRFIATKRPGDILEVARRIGPRAEFILAGEGPVWNRVQQEARTIGPHVHVMGWTEQIRALLYRCTVAVFPSMFREGLPRFLLEAQAAGKPIVAYDVRGSSDAIEDGQSGLLVRPADVDAFCDAVERLLDDGNLRTRMGQMGRRRVREGFALKASVTAQLEALSGVLAQKGIQAPWG